MYLFYVTYIYIIYILFDLNILSMAPVLLFKINGYITKWRYWHNSSYFILLMTTDMNDNDLIYAAAVPT